MEKFIERLQNEVTEKKGYIKELINEMNSKINDFDGKSIIKLTHKIQLYTMEVEELQTKIYVIEQTKK